MSDDLPPPMTHDVHERRRWLALIVLCLGVLMIVLDTTIVNVALPSIREDLGFNETSLVWVVNAYILTFGGFCCVRDDPQWIELPAATSSLETCRLPGRDRVSAAADHPTGPAADCGPRPAGRPRCAAA